jgi:recombinational DNA repair protein (RecF pathway)
MATNPNPDRSQEYMMQMWGTHSLITDYKIEGKQIIQEIMHDDLKKNKFKKSNDLHQQIRNDDDYDDWEYGTEPNYGIV